MIIECQIYKKDSSLALCPKSQPNQAWCLVQNGSVIAEFALEGYFVRHLKAVFTVTSETTGVWEPQFQKLLEKLDNNEVPKIWEFKSPCKPGTEIHFTLYSAPAKYLTLYY